MSKRQKSQPVSKLMPRDKTISPAKERRIALQLEQTNDNKTRKQQGDPTPWEKSKASRGLRRL